MEKLLQDVGKDILPGVSYTKAVNNKLSLENKHLRNFLFAVLYDLCSLSVAFFYVEVIIVCGGSYRRGKASCGDMDIIITHPDGER